MKVIVRMVVAAALCVPVGFACKKQQPAPRAPAKTPTVAKTATPAATPKAAKTPEPKKATPTPKPEVPKPVTTPTPTPGKPAASGNQPVVVIRTTMGEIEVELDQQHAPVTVKNFLRYVDANFYDGTVFHRVINTFMIQGGGFTQDLRRKPTPYPPIKLEVGNGLSNVRGTIAMARTSDPNSATSQFFINVKDNSRALDPNPTSQGYAVFGKVIAGMDVVDKIRNVPVRPEPRIGSEATPIKPVVIESIRRKK